MLIGCGIGVMIFAILISGYYFCNVRYVSFSWRGGIAEKYISHYSIGMEAEYG